MTDQLHSTSRVLLLMSPATYRAGAFLESAERLGLDVLRGIDLPRELAEEWHVPLGLDFRDPVAAEQEIVAYAAIHPLAAILSVDDTATVLAARASAALGLPHNSPEAALAARDKLRMRQLLAAAGVPSPAFRRFSIEEDAGKIAQQVDYPCVVKPLHLNASRGVIRANDPEEFVAAFTRLRRFLLAEGSPPEETYALVEAFIPGFEVALEGLLTGSRLNVLALFDKPDPLNGPFFEETIYVTPSRLPETAQRAIADCTARAAAALGLREGPVHAELRINDLGPWIVELAGRSIGGLCSTVLRFGADVCLEELILRHAVGLELPPLRREEAAVGVMMIPIPAAGILKAVHGVEEAKAVPHVEGVEITAKRNYRLVPLPEGGSYLGFIFARAADPATVETALREAHGHLQFHVEPEIPVLRGPVQTHSTLLRPEKG